MLHTVKPAAWMALCLICFTGIAGISWQNNPASLHHNDNFRDTTPKKEADQETIINGDLNKAMEQVEKAREDLERQLQDRNWEKQAQRSFEQLDAQKLQAQLAEALKNIDLQKLQMQTQAALKQVDWQAMQKNMQKAMEEVKNNINQSELQKNVQKAIAESQKAMARQPSIDMEKLRLSLDKLREEFQMNQGRMQETIERAKKQSMENFPENFHKAMDRAKEGIARASEELRNYKAMLDEMDKDGLLEADQYYDIEYKKGDLFINGRQQPASVTEKYRHYFKKGNVRIKKDKDEEGGKTIHL